MQRYAKGVWNQFPHEYQGIAVLTPPRKRCYTVRRLRKHFTVTFYLGAEFSLRTILAHGTCECVLVYVTACEQANILRTSGQYKGILASKKSTRALHHELLLSLTCALTARGPENCSGCPFSTSQEPRRGKIFLRVRPSVSRAFLMANGK